jgi:Flp pilus assembly protein TadD
MKLTRSLQFVLVCGASCGLLGCKSPMTWFSPSPHAASTAPDVRYNGVSGSSATVKQNAGAALGSTPKPEGTMAKAWNSTTGAVTSLLGTSSKSKDATSLSTKPGKLDADIYLRAAAFAEQSGDLAEAETKYQQALKTAPKNVNAIVGLARLYDQQGNSHQAIATYQQAIKLHPKNAMVYNDLGLCYGRRRELAQSQQMLQKAVELEPGKAAYRMNLAVVLVDMGQPAIAYQNLLAVQAEGVAHYNLACLLESCGQVDQAVDHLHQALAKDPALTPARELLAQLTGGLQPPLQMASATLTGRERRNAHSRQGNQRMQLDPADLQAPNVNYGPAVPPIGEGAFQPDGTSAPQQQVRIRRTSLQNVADDENAQDSTPTTVRITDDEE